MKSPLLSPSMNNTLKSVFLIAMASMGSALSFYGLYETNTIGRYASEYMAPSIILNVIVVAYILYRISNSFGRVPARRTYVILAFVLLLAGLIAEIYLTVFLVKLPDQISTYIVAVINYLIRLFYLVNIDLCASPHVLSKVAASVVAPVSNTKLPDDIWKLLNSASKDSEGKRVITDEQYRTIKNKLLSDTSLQKESEITKLVNSMKK